MKRILWLVVMAAVLALAGSASEISRLKTRIGAISRHQFHDHAEVRQFIIRAALADAKQPIIVVGDSIAEMAPLPSQLCGHPVVNAGVGGMTIREALPMLRNVLDGRVPYFVVLAIGANDNGSNRAGDDFADLLIGAASISPRLLAIAVSSNPSIDATLGLIKVPYINPYINPTTKMSDGIHYTSAAYGVWIPALENAIVALCR